MRGFLLAGGFVIVFVETLRVISGWIDLENNLKVQEQKGKTELSKRRCAEIDAMLNNLNNALNYIKNEQLCSESRAKQRYDELTYLIEARRAECEEGADGFMVKPYLQINAELPPDWPNWWIKFYRKES